MRDDGRCSSTFSFNQTKNMTCGEGGAVLASGRPDP
ncbi:DegT/DnrJ/EryC1/StrS family aminotransferase [Rhodophyticola sp.]